MYAVCDLGQVGVVPSVSAVVYVGHVQPSEPAVHSGHRGHYGVSDRYYQGSFQREEVVTSVGSAAGAGEPPVVYEPQVALHRAGYGSC